MIKSELLKGVLLVSLGASFYGMLATVVKLSYNQGFSLPEVTTAQYLIGLVGMSLFVWIQGKISKKELAKPSGEDIWKLLLAGTTFGMTSLFYYSAVHFLDVSIAIVLLMQSVWLSVLLESLLDRKFPSTRKIIATIIVLTGTVFATNAVNSEVSLNWKGIMFGMLAATSFSITMFTSNRIATHLPALRKTLLMLTGGTAMVLLFAFFSQIGPQYIGGFFENTKVSYIPIKEFDLSVFWRFGLFLAVFGTILPPIMFNLGFPRTGLGLGSIVSSLELPVSVTMAFVLLSETVLPIQWMGIAMILAAIVYMNVGSKVRS